MRARSPVGGRCAKPTRSKRAGRPCSRRVRLRGTLATSGKAGANRFTFKRRIGGRRLARGRYILSATPTANGRAGATRTVTFKIVR